MTISLLYGNVDNMFLWKITMFSKTRMIWWEIGIVLHLFLFISFKEDSYSLTSASVLGLCDLLFSRYVAVNGSI